MRKLYEEALSPAVQMFRDRDDYKQQTGQEALPHDEGRPLSSFRIASEYLDKMNPGKKNVVLDPIALKHPNGVYDRDSSGRITITDSEPILRAHLREPNFLPRERKPHYGPYQSIRLEPLLKVFGPGQGLFVGGGSFGDVPWFEDGISDAGAPAQGGGFTAEDRRLLLLIRSEQSSNGEAIARIEYALKGFTKP